MLRTLIITTALFIASSSLAETLNISISGIRNTKGKIQVAVFKSQKQFDDEEPYKILYFSKSNLKDGKLTVKCELPTGTYAITVLDDEDNSKDMTYKFGIYPTEGVGFSNHKLSGLTKPKFTDFDFKLSSGGTTVKVSMKYF